jgi:hypothetical protein
MGMKMEAEGNVEIHHRTMTGEDKTHSEDSMCCSELQGV